MAWEVEWLILLEMIVKMLTHIHIVVYTWWCWHIYKGDEVGVDVDQLGDETEARRVKNSKVKRAWPGAMGDRPGSSSRGRMSEDKVRRKDWCWSVRAVYVLGKLSYVSYRMVSEPTLAVSRVRVSVAQAWCAWLVWTQSGHPAWHMRWHWTYERGQEGTFLAWG